MLHYELPFQIVASSLEEQKQLTKDISKALKAEVIQLTCGETIKFGLNRIIGSSIGALKCSQTS